MIALTDIEKRIKHLWRTYGTLNNIVMVVALGIAASWAWGTISMMQTNFAAQKAVDDQVRELKLTELEVATLQYQQNYYKSDEYKELMARTKLGLALPGEKVLVLPPNSEAVKASDAANSTQASTDSAKAANKGSNFEQWLEFLTGNSAQNLQG